MSERHPYEDSTLLVLSGAGRSGTTALHQALSDHPAIESSRHVQNIVSDLLGTARKNQIAPTRRPAMRLGDERYQGLFRRLLLDLVFPDAPPLNPGSAALVFTTLTRETAPYLLATFPRARVVCLVRDGVEVVRSRLAHEHLGADSFENHCAVWANAAATGLWAKSEPRAMTLPYERLCADPGGAIEEIEAFADLEHDDAPARRLQTHRYHPTRHPGSHDWKHWSPENRAVFNEICGEPMRRLGYRVPWTEPAISSTR